MLGEAIIITMKPGRCCSTTLSNPKTIPKKCLRDAKLKRRMGCSCIGRESKQAILRTIWQYRIPQRQGLRRCPTRHRRTRALCCSWDQGKRPMTRAILNFDRLLKLRLVVARFGEMDLAKWWNTRGQLGRLGTAAMRRGFPRTHYFAQSRSVFAVAAH